jgi:quercetin dioxygenase-like cupin family protein
MHGRDLNKLAVSTRRLRLACMRQSRDAASGVTQSQCVRLRVAGGAVRVGAGSRSDLHRHHSVQLVMALRGTLRFRTGRYRRWTTAAAVLVQPDAWHEVDA